MKVAESLAASYCESEVDQGPNEEEQNKQYLWAIRFFENSRIEIICTVESSGFGTSKPPKCADRVFLNHFMFPSRATASSSHRQWEGSCAETQTTLQKYTGLFCGNTRLLFIHSSFADIYGVLRRNAVLF